ncbi:tripartite tricarboxylate transporter substrate binding protein [Pollutimonas bauzanensis]|uniref:Tripartite-type tricarboxylate transporter, receptor component TctC n=1 Tax=Pollutimonas bauzanensis TaxID=658167 RepID=A0A1M5UYF4_9BURK|nr:tripartite tricarboxylate transporter substrate binding protein [Pollutimonas bauzanensis]SHH67924.1 Tripartite-type tricarboxylate transporter, receptor component TctC [Pollutimonas bauzanensis]
MKKIPVLFQACALAAGLLLTSAGAWSQAYPAKQVRVIVPYAPGGGADILARLIGQKLGASWGQPVIVDNKAGAGGSIGTENASRAAPDGYTLLMASPSHAINATLYKNLSFDPQKDFNGVTLVASGPLVLVVNASNPANSVKEFIDQARSKPGSINYASAGVGSSPHLAGELFNMQAKVDLVHIAYKGTSPALTDLLGGQVQAMFAPVPTVIEYVKAGKLKALGVTTPKAFAALPGVPAVADDVPGYEVLQWWGIAAPAGTPADIIAKLNTDIAAALRSPDIQQKLATMGAEPGGQSAAQFDQLIHSEVEKWAEVIKTANIQAS